MRLWYNTSFSITCHLRNKRENVLPCVMIYDIKNLSSQCSFICLPSWRFVWPTGGSRRLHWRGSTAASPKNTEQISKLGGLGACPLGVFFLHNAKCSKFGHFFFIFIRPLGEGPWPPHWSCLWNLHSPMLLGENWKNKYNVQQWHSYRGQGGHGPPKAWQKW